MAERSNMILTVPSRAAAIASPERVCLMKPPIDLPGFDVKQYWHERFDSEPGNIWLRAHIARIRQVEARTACQPEWEPRNIDATKLRLGPLTYNSLLESEERS